jgi:hypothetical protein
MFKKSPKNCFKPVLPSAVCSSSSGVGGAGPEHETTELHKSNNGPILSYFNYFLLPQIDILLGPDGDYAPLELRVLRDDNNHVYVSSSIYAHLCDIKHQIEKYQDTWDNIKKFTNPYEYIHSNITGNKTNISKLRPLSRSFYKMIEIIKNIKAQA